MSTSIMVSPQELANLKKYLGLPSWAQRKHVYADVVRPTVNKPDNPNIGKVYYMWGRGAFLCFKDQLTTPWVRKAFQKKLNFDEVIPFPKKTTEWERMGKPEPEEPLEGLDVPITPPSTPVSTASKRKTHTVTLTEHPAKKQKLSPLEEEEETIEDYTSPKTPDFNNEMEQ